MIIRRVGPLSCAKIAGTLYAIVGLLIGGVFSLVAMAGGFAADTSAGAGIATALGAGAIVIAPVVYGGLGFLSALIGAWLYNLLAGMVGGIELDVQ